MGQVPLVAGELRRRGRRAPAVGVRHLGLREQVRRRDGARVPVVAAVAPVERGVVREVGLLDARDLDAARDDRGLRVLPAHVRQLGALRLDLAVVDLGQERGHVRVHHRREELRVKPRVAEALLEAVPRVVVALRVDLGLVEFRVRRDVVPEGWLEGTVDVRLEDDDEQDRWDRCNPVQGLEAVLKPNGCTETNIDQDCLQRSYIDVNVLRTMINCMRTTPTRRRLMTTFHMRCCRVSDRGLPGLANTLTPPLSVLETKTNIS